VVVAGSYAFFLASFPLLVRDLPTFWSAFGNVALYAPVAYGWMEAPLAFWDHWTGAHPSWWAFLLERALWIGIMLVWAGRWFVHGERIFSSCTWRR
jgi:hypothetical protein